MSYLERAREELNTGIDLENQSLDALLLTHDTLTTALMRAISATDNLSKGQTELQDSDKSLAETSGITTEIGKAILELAGLAGRAGIEADDALKAALEVSQKVHLAQGSANESRANIDPEASGQAMRADNTAYDAANIFASATEDSPTPEATQYMADTTDFAGSVNGLLLPAEEFSDATNTANDDSTETIMAIKHLENVRERLTAAITAVLDINDEFALAVESARMKVETQQDRMHEAEQNGIELASRTLDVVNENNELRKSAAEVIRSAQERLAGPL